MTATWKRRLIRLIAIILTLWAQAGHAQPNIDAARRQLLCAQLGVDFSDPVSMMMYRRCLQQGPAANLGRPVGPIPQLVKPVGPLVTPVGPLVTPLNNRPQATARAGDGCVQGYVWRETTAADHVCVVPSMRQQARNDNAQARARVNPTNHDYGPDTCRGGFVWREASPTDHVCVTPEMRAQARADNDAAPSRVAR